MALITPASQSIEQVGETFIFRDKATGLYVGYDGFDTDFSRGISAFIPEEDILHELNTRLITYSTVGIEVLLNNQLDKMWVKMGGYGNLDIIRLDIVLEGEAFSPGDLAHMLTVERISERSDNDPDSDTTS